MKKAILGLMVFLMVGGVFAMSDPLGFGMEEPRINKPTIGPNKITPTIDHGVVRNHCDLIVDICDWRLKFMDSETIDIGDERFYLKYLGDNNIFVTNAQYNWLNPLRYEGITTISDEGDITLGDHEATYEVKEKTYGDDRIFVTL